MTIHIVTGKDKYEAGPLFDAIKKALMLSENLDEYELLRGLKVRAANVSPLTRMLLDAMETIVDCEADESWETEDGRLEDAYSPNVIAKDEEPANV